MRGVLSTKAPCHQVTGTDNQLIFSASVTPTIYTLGCRQGNEAPHCRPTFSRLFAKLCTIWKFFQIHEKNYPEMKWWCFLVKIPLTNPFFVKLISVSDKLWPVKLEFVVLHQELHPTKHFRYFDPSHRSQTLFIYLKLATIFRFKMIRTCEVHSPQSF